MKLNQIIEPNVEPQVAKLTAMYAAGDPVDVSLSPMQYLASYIDQGIAQPIDGLPGVDQYVKDFTPFTRAIAQRDGKTWGLPYFSTVWTFIYNAELLAKVGFKDKPFKSYPELIDQARKAKKDGVSKYPILWIAGAGFEQLPGTWFSLTANRGGVIFDKALAPQLGAGSVARETLKWWQSTFKEEFEKRFIARLSEVTCNPRPVARLNAAMILARIAAGTQLRNLGRGGRPCEFSGKCAPSR